MEMDARNYWMVLSLITPKFSIRSQSSLLYLRVMQKLLTRLAGHSYTPVTQKHPPKFVVYLEEQCKSRVRTHKAFWTTECQQVWAFCFSKCTTLLLSLWNLFIEKCVEFIAVGWPWLQGLLELSLLWLCLTWALIPWPTALPYTSHCNLIWVQLESFVYLLLDYWLIQQDNFLSDIHYLPKLKLSESQLKGTLLDTGWAIVTIPFRL
jgi:hypothetical protein